MTLAPLIVACLVSGQAQEPATASGSALERGRAALTLFDIDRAQLELEQAVLIAGYSYDDNVALWTSLGVARAYAGRKNDAEAAFLHLLAIDPTAVLSYTLSPKVTFPFEAARDNVQRDPVVTVEINWPHGQSAGDPLPVRFEVTHDRLSLIHDVSLCYARDSHVFDCTLPVMASTASTMTAPPPSSAPAGTESVKMYVMARDAQGSVVYRSSDPGHARLMQLEAREVRPWWQHWYVLAATSAVAIGVTALVVHISSSGPATTAATFEWKR